MSKDLFEFLRESKAYRKVLDHRRSCNKWEKEFCMKCFGGGLTIFLRSLDDEFYRKKKNNQNG